MTDTNGSRTKLDARTWIPIGVLVSILGVAIWATAVVVGGFKDSSSQLVELTVAVKGLTEGQKDTNASVRNLSDDMYRMRVDLNGVLDGPWKQRDMKFWVLAAQQAIDRAGVKIELPPVVPVDNAPAPNGARK